MSFAVDLTSAEAYDRWFDSPWGRYAFAVEAKAVRNVLGALPGHQSLDAGCGTGRFSQELQKLGAAVIGLDNDAAMLAVARRRTRIPLVLADAQALPFSNACFDVVVAVTLCEFVADVAAVFSELARVTRPGGRCVVGSLNPRSPWGFWHSKGMRRPPWSRARFLSRDQLIELGAPYGDVSIRAALYAPGAFVGLENAGGILESIGKIAPRFGAFQVLSVRRHGRQG